MAREHIRAFRDVSGFEICGIFSRTRSKAESLASEFGIPFVCDSPQDLYERTKADLVVVAVSVLEAKPVTQSCVGFPWRILVEKPAGHHLEEAEEIRHAASSAGATVYVALNRRFLSSTRAALQDLAALEGRRFIHVQDQQSRQQASAAGHPPRVLDHWMFVNSIHTIDYFRIFGRGKITNIRSVVPWKGPASDLVVSVVEFDSGDIGLYQALWNRPGPWSVSITVSDKRWELRPLEQAAYQSINERQAHKVDPTEWDIQFKPGLRLQAEHAHLALDGSSSELPTLDDAVATMRLIHQIYN